MAADGPGGYSGTPLPRKLGLRPGMRLHARGAPDHYRELLDPTPDGARWFARLVNDLDFAHLFVTRRRNLEAELPRLHDRLAPDGMIWVSWPKRASKVETDVTEDVVRDVALPRGLVDVKVCAVDATWSGLKLVIRKVPARLADGRARPEASGR